MADKTPMEAETYFIAVLAKNGQVITLPEMPEDGIQAERPVTNYDVYETSRQVVEEFNNSLLAQKVAEMVIAGMNQPAPQVSDKIKDALKERGFQTDTGSNN
jgi:uncharacterized protein